MSTQAEKSIVVIGAGVIGLTTAIKIQEQGGYRVTIVAEHFPTDPKTVKYTSLWAGAHHVSSPDYPLKAELEKETLKTLWELSAEGSPAQRCFIRAKQTNYYTIERADPDYLSFMPDFQHIPVDTIPSNIKGAIAGITCTTLNIDTPAYLSYLLARFASGGGKLIRGAIQHINQIFEAGPRVFSQPPSKVKESVDALIVCAGLGARFLGGIEDQDIYPIRGQVLILRAPWVNFGMSCVTDEGVTTYVIPRGYSGDVIVGGTREVDDWYPISRPETTTCILERAIIMCPELAPPSVRATRTPTADDLRAILIEEGCGFRPGRKGTVLIGSKLVQAPSDGRSIPVVSNYGHGGFGFQSSWGSAERALKLLQESLASSA